MLEFNGKVVKPVIKGGVTTEIGGINIKVINHIGMYHGFCDPSLASDFSAYVKEKLGVHLVCLYRFDPNKEGGYTYSVRSGDSDIQVTARAIAEHFGGGGHDKAAGFSSSKLLTD
jgi:nanoRNase/pAp phosphatase (c-di-AMP/oligoRNAs hydrolase)